MNKKKGIIFAIVVGLAVISCVLLLGILQKLKEDDAKDTIAKADVAKMTAALFDTFEETLQGEDGIWYLKYMNDLCGKGYMKDTIGAEGFTYGDLKYMLDAFGVSLKDIPGTNNIVKWKNNYIGVTEWYNVYNYLIAYTKAPVTCIDLMVIGTPANIENMDAWTAYTDQGYFGFDGIALDSSIDSVVRVLVRGDEIIARLETVSTNLNYKNIWIKESSENQILAYTEGVNRTFQVEGLSEELSNCMADVIIENQKVAKLELKKDSVRGKVLSISDNQIEIEGYGTVGLDEEYKAFRLYGEFGETALRELVIGYDRQNFFVADGKICGIAFEYPLQVENIRVLLKDSDFAKEYHEEVQVSSESGIKIFDCTTNELIREGDKKEIVDLAKEGILVEGRRVRIEPVKADAQIQLNSLKRSSGTPSYPGMLEIEQKDKVFYIVNDVNFEEYLKRVVPSEMPVSYGSESSKVQAVCARSYAYIQLFDRSNQKYGAHINDSTSYQVYNNIGTQKVSNEAVDATCGEVIKYGTEVIEAFYYSTSCGYGTDVGIWNDDHTGYEYLKAHGIRSDDVELDLTNNDTFLDYIIRKNFSDYDVAAPLYRWKTEMTLKEVNQYYGEKANVGNISSMEITKRLPGGVAVELVVTGDKGNCKIEGEYEIRKFLGNSEIYWRNNLESLFQMSMLPSSFAALRERSYKGVITGYEIIGGGYGHGVGMSQNATRIMAQKGMNYKDIISFFYDGVTIEKLY